MGAIVSLPLLIFVPSSHLAFTVRFSMTVLCWKYRSFICERVGLTREQELAFTEAKFGEGGQFFFSRPGILSNLIGFDEEEGPHSVMPFRWKGKLFKLQCLAPS